MLADTPFFPSSMNGFSVIRTCADLLNFACLFLLYIYRWYSLDIIIDMHRTNEKTAFAWEFDSIIMQNDMSHNLLLFSAQTVACVQML